MSEVKPEEKNNEVEKEKLKKSVDGLFVQYLGKYKPEADKKAVTGDHVMKKIDEMIGEGNTDLQVAVVKHPLYQFLSKNAETTFSGDELVVEALKRGIDLPDEMKNDNVNDMMNGNAAKTPDKGQSFDKSSASSKEKSKDFPDKELFEAAKKIASDHLDANPEYKEKQRKYYSQKNGGIEISDDKLLELEARKVLKNLKAAQNEVANNNEQGELQGAAPQGAVQAIGRGIGGLFRGLKEGAKSSAKAMDNWARFERPAKKIMSKEASKAIKEVDAKMNEARTNLETLSSNTDANGNMLSTKDKKALQSETINALKKCNESFDKFTELADNPVLPNKDRHKLHKKAEEIAKFSEELKMHPDGKSKLDKEFKEQLNEQAKAMADIAKKIVKMIKSFFQKKGHENKVDSTPEMSM